MTRSPYSSARTCRARRPSDPTGRSRCRFRSRRSSRRRCRGASPACSRNGARDVVRVLVTGGAGYIGSVVSEELTARGHAVVAYDNLARGHRDAVPEAAPLVIGDVLDAATLTAELREHRIDGVVHLAGLSLVGESVTDPARYYRVNVVGGLTLIDAMRVAGVGLLVFSSSAAVYGEPAKQPIEEDDPPAPTNPYGETKLAVAHVRALDALAAGAPGGVYNLGCGGEGYTVREVIETAAAVTGRRIATRVGGRRPGDPATLVAATGRITRELGWRAQRQDLREIISSAWQYERKRVER